MLFAHQLQRVADGRVFFQSLFNTFPNLAAARQQAHVAHHVQTVAGPGQCHANPIAKRQEANRAGLVATDQREQDDFGFLALVVVHHRYPDSVQLFVALAFLESGFDTSSNIIHHKYRGVL